MKTKTKCECGKLAVWNYLPAKENEQSYYCDDCVPRGCSCNHELKENIDYDSPEAQKPENYIERLDNKGRKLPCCEYVYEPEGFDIF